MDGALLFKTVIVPVEPFATCLPMAVQGEFLGRKAAKYHAFCCFATQKLALEGLDRDSILPRGLPQNRHLPTQRNR
ncbi:MAG: hypothetical protein ACJAWN_002942 [Neolewinella sp.]|jgi:hypothetical protein